MNSVNAKNTSILSVHSRRPYFFNSFFECKIVPAVFCSSSLVPSTFADDDTNVSNVVALFWVVSDKCRDIANIFSVTLSCWNTKLVLLCLFAPRFRNSPVLANNSCLSNFSISIIVFMLARRNAWSVLKWTKWIDCCIEAIRIAKHMVNSKVYKLYTLKTVVDGCLRLRRDPDCSDQLHSRPIVQCIFSRRIISIDQLHLEYLILLMNLETSQCPANITSWYVNTLKTTAINDGTYLSLWNYIQKKIVSSRKIYWYCDLLHCTIYMLTICQINKAFSQLNFCCYLNDGFHM